MNFVTLSAAAVPKLATKLSSKLLKISNRPQLSAITGARHIIKHSDPVALRIAHRPPTAMSGVGGEPGQAVLVTPRRREGE